MAAVRHILFIFTNESVNYRMTTFIYFYERATITKFRPKKKTDMQYLLIQVISTSLNILKRQRQIDFGASSPSECSHCLFVLFQKQDINKTRMYSSRMRTVRCCGRLGGGGVYLGGCLPREGVHPTLWTEFLTHTCENTTFQQTTVADGNNK